MVRPCKCRRVECSPGVTYFKPRGIPVAQLDEVILSLDEYEAIRLADQEGLYQEAAAEQMNISRQTFGNILRTAHQKVAEALVQGLAMKIEGGSYQMETMKKFQCAECNHTWETAYGSGRPVECPQCHSKLLHRAEEDRGRRRRRGHEQGPNRCRRRTI